MKIGEFSGSESNAGKKKKPERSNAGKRQKNERKMLAFENETSSNGFKLTDSSAESSRSS